MRASSPTAFAVPRRIASLIAALTCVSSAGYGQMPPPPPQAPHGQGPQTSEPSEPSEPPDPAAPPPGSTQPPVDAPAPPPAEAPAPTATPAEGRPPPTGATAAEPTRPPPEPTPPATPGTPEAAGATVPSEQTAPPHPLPTVTQVQVAVPTTAIVHIAVDYDDAWLELRSITDQDAWQRACPAPCDRELAVDGKEARVSAPGMITSNAFRIEPGGGVARLRVAGGSATARTVGLGLMLAGLPVSFGGMAAFGLGATQDEPAVETVGLIAAIVGGVAIVSSLPLLLSGSTNVRNQDGDYIAGDSTPTF